MTKLTTTQKTFLKRLDVPHWRVFDATDMRRADYMQEMRDVDRWLAIGVTPCKAAAALCQ